MSDLNTFVKKVLDELIKTNYPNAATPANVVAVIKNKKADGSVYRYTIRVIDRNGNEDQEVPEIPEVISENEYQVGEKVVAANVQGIIQPYIIGRWHK